MMLNILWGCSENMFTIEQQKNIRNVSCSKRCITATYKSTKMRKIKFWLLYFGIVCGNGGKMLGIWRYAEGILSFANSRIKNIFSPSIATWDGITFFFLICKIARSAASMVIMKDVIIWHKQFPPVNWRFGGVNSKAKANLISRITGSFN